MPERRGRAGRVLFLAGSLFMVTGDWPTTTMLADRGPVPLDVLSWPLLYLALLAASFALLLKDRILRITRPTAVDFLHPALTLLAAAFLLSVLRSQVPALSWWAFGGFLGILAFFLVVARVLEDDTCARGLGPVLAAAAIGLAARVIVWRVDEGLTFAAGDVGNNAWIGKIQLAWALNLPAPLLLARFLGERRWPLALWYGTAWVLSGAAVYVLFSKAGWVTFALTTLLLCVINPAAWRRWVLILAGFTGLAVALIAVSPAMWTSVVDALAHVDRDTGIVMRQAVWRETAQMIADQPLTGIGLGAYDDVAFSRYATSGDRHFFRMGWHAHNMFLHVLAETGAVGFLAWGYLGFTLARFLLRRWRHGDAGERLHAAAGLGVLAAFATLSMTEAMLAARVYAYARMNLTLALLVVYAIRMASPARSATPAGG